jgi:hypothetical protein
MPAIAFPVGIVNADTLLQHTTDATKNASESFMLRINAGGGSVGEGERYEL